MDGKFAENERPKRYADEKVALMLEKYAGGSDGMRARMMLGGDSLP